MSQIRTIEVEVNTHKPTTTGKDRWSIKDKEDNWYGVWDSSLAARLPVGYRGAVVVEQKGDFLNIKGLAPAEEADSVLAPTPKPAQTGTVASYNYRETALMAAATLFGGSGEKSAIVIEVANQFLGWLNTEQKSSSNQAGDDLVPDKFIAKG